MALAYLLSAAPKDPDRNPWAHLDLEQLLASAAQDRFRIHRLCDDPDDADVILFVETVGYKNHYFQQVRRHPVYRRFPAKSYVFAATDKVVALLPGVYASIERRWYSRAWTRSGHYPGVTEEPGRRYDAESVPTLLFSFVGSVGSHRDRRARRVRRRVMQLQHPDGLLIDSHAESLAIARGDRAPVSPDDFAARYVRSITDSSFVLCPRGGGPSSFRLFETMMFGRVPVVVSDQWVPPVGPDWESFSVRVRERKIDAIPGLLEALASDAPSMGRAARRAWVDWFSEGASFHRTVEWCLDLARFASGRTGVRRYVPFVQMLRPYHAVRVVAKKLGEGHAPTEAQRHASSVP